MDAKDQKKLDNYLAKNLGVKTQEFLTLEWEVLKDMEGEAIVVPERYNYGIHFPINIKKGARIKILDKKISQPLGYSNDILFDLIESPIKFKANFRVSLEDLVEALKKKPLE